MNTNETSVGEFVGAAFVSYVATNIDDLVILMNFFTEATVANAIIKNRHIFIGQYLGIIIILGVSLIGYGVSYALPVKMLGFLGFFPIVLGVKGIIEIIIDEYKKTTIDIDDIVPNDNVSTIELQTIRYQNSNNEQVIWEPTRIHSETQTESQSPPTSMKFKQKVVKLLSHCLNLQTLKVTSITIANSGDNVAIYTPLFAQAIKWQIGVYIVIFLGMTLVWLIFCYLFIHFRPILYLAQRYAHNIVPVIFIGIGIYIIVKSECFPWLVTAIRTKSFKDG